MIFNLITCIPLSINPCRREIYLSIMKREGNKCEHFFITVILFWLTAVIGTLFPDVINAFGILGGFMAVPIVIYYPGFLYLKLNKAKWYSPFKLFLLVLTVVLCVIGFGAAFISLFDLIGLISVPK